MQIHIQSDISFLLHELSSDLLKAGYIKPYLDFSPCHSYEVQCAMGVSEQELQSFLEVMYPLQPPVKRDLTNPRKEVHIYIGDDIAIKDWQIVLNSPHGSLEQLKDQLQPFGFEQLIYKKSIPTQACMKYGGASLMIQHVLQWLFKEQSSDIKLEQVWEITAKDIWLYLPLSNHDLQKIKQNIDLKIITDDKVLAQEYQQILHQHGYQHTSIVTYNSFNIAHENLAFYCYLAELTDQYEEKQHVQQLTMSFMQAQHVDLNQHPLQILTHQQSSMLLETSEMDHHSAYIMLPFQAYQNETLYPIKGQSPLRWTISVTCDDVSKLTPLIEQLKLDSFTRIQVIPWDDQKECYGASIDWGSAAAHPTVVAQIMSAIEVQIGSFPFIQHTPMSALDGTGSNEDDNQIFMTLCTADQSHKHWLKKLHKLCHHTHMNVVMNVSDLHPLIQAIRQIPLASFQLINPQEYIEQYGYDTEKSVSTHWQQPQGSHPYIPKDDLNTHYPLDDEEDNDSISQYDTLASSESLQHIWESFGGLPSGVPSNDHIIIRYGGVSEVVIQYVQQIIEQHVEGEVERISCWPNDDLDIVIEFPFDLTTEISDQAPSWIDWNEWFIFGPSLYQVHSLVNIQNSDTSSQITFADLTLTTPTPTLAFGKVPNVTLSQYFIESQEAEKLYQIVSCIQRDQACYLQIDRDHGQLQLILLIASLLHQPVFHQSAHLIEIDQINDCIKNKTWIIMENMSHASSDIQHYISKTLSLTGIFPTVLIMCDFHVSTNSNPLLTVNTWYDRCYTLHLPSQHSPEHYESVLQHLVFAPKYELLLYAKHYEVTPESAMYDQLATLVDMQVFLTALASLHYGVELLLESNQHFVASPTSLSLPSYWYMFHMILSDMCFQNQSHQFPLPKGINAYQQHREKSYTMMRKVLKKYYIDPFPSFHQQQDILQLLEQLGIGILHWNLASSYEA